MKKLARQLPPIVGRCAQDAAEVLEDRDATLSSGRDDARENFLSPSAAGVAIAAEDLAIDHGWADCLLGGPIRRLEVGVVEVSEDRLAVLDDVGRELPVLVVGEVLPMSASQTWSETGFVKWS